MMMDVSYAVASACKTLLFIASVLAAYCCQLLGLTLGLCDSFQSTAALCSSHLIMIEAASTGKETSEPMDTVMQVMTNPVRTHDVVRFVFHRMYCFASAISFFRSKSASASSIVCVVECYATHSRKLQPRVCLMLTRVVQAATSLTNCLSLYKAKDSMCAPFVIRHTTYVTRSTLDTSLSYFFVLRDPANPGKC
jgi:hypothetical protein